MRTVTAFLLLVSMAFGEKPSPKIDGPTTRHAGALTFLDACGSSGAESFGWMVDTSDVTVPADGKPDVAETVEQLRKLGFDVHEPDDKSEPLWAVSEDGKRLWLSSYPGVYRIVLGVGNADGLVMLPWTVTVGEVKPPKPDPPKPDPPKPDPDPPVPTPSTPIGLLTYAGVLATPERTGFDKVSDIYRTASKNAAGFASVEALLASVKDATNKLGTGTVASWTPIARVLEAQLDVMRDAKEIDTTKPATYQKPFLEIANGITSALGK